MESGFGQNLEGFLIKGNLSLAPSANPVLQGDGSIEGSGTLYIDTINEYNSTNGVTIQDVSFKDGKMLVPYNLQSDNITSASVIINGGVSIKHTQNSNSVTSGGGLTVAGGGSFGKNVYIGGILDISGNKITNVATPIDGTDGVNKDYVDLVANKVGGDFTKGQVIIGDSNGDAIRGYDFLTTDTNTLNLSLPFTISNTADNSLQVSGGIIAGGGINLSGNSIIEVGLPQAPTDAVNKFYVDNLISNLDTISGNFTSGQLIVADTSGNTIRGYSNLLFNGSELSLLSTIENSFVCYGGISIDKTAFIGGGLNVNNKTITNVATPVLGTDAVNKDYLSLYNELSGNISGIFTSGQLLIADTLGNKIKGYNNITFNSINGTDGTLLLSNTNLIIKDTTNGSGLGTGGGLTVLGGASFNKDVYIGGVLDVNLQNIKNVADPVENYDAVNKEYVDTLFADCCSGGGGGGGGGFSTNIFNLTNNVLVAQDIPVFYYPESILAFTASVYVQYNNENMALYTIRGIHCGNNWTISSSYVGDPLGVKFFIRNNSGQGLLQYTNKNTTGSASIRFSTTSIIDNSASSNQLNINISSNISTFTNIPVLSYVNSIIDSFKLIIFVSSETDNQCGMFFLNSVYTDNKWICNVHNIGDISGLEFNVSGSGSGSGVVQYKNSNISNDYVIRVLQYTFLTSQPRVILTDNTLISTNINSTDLSFQNITNFQLSLIANDALNNKSALYEIYGVLNGNVWKLNSRYIGDNLQIKFLINTISGNTGVLQYTNLNSNEISIRFTKNIQNLFEPLSVTLGGTGNSRFTPYAVLRGDGTNPIMGTDDFIYKNYQLTLGPSSSIFLKNTETATSISNGGTLTSYGGASFKKDVFIGGELDVNLKNIRNVADPILNYDAVNKHYVDAAISNLDLNNNNNRIEQTFTLNNNVAIPTDIPNFEFPDTIKAFVSNIYVECGNVSSLYTIRGVNCNTKWSLNSSLIGSRCGVEFFIRKDNNIGYVQYINRNNTGTTSIKYTVNTKVFTDQNALNQIYYTLSNADTLTDIPILRFSNTILHSVKLFIYISSELDNRYGLVLANCVLKNNIWDINTYNIGDIGGIKFSIRSDISSSTIQYTNQYSQNDYTIRVTNVDILNDQVPVVLSANTTLPTNIDTPLLNTPLDSYYFQISIFVNLPDISKSALYEIQGVVSNNEWNINSRYVGDYTGIRFYITTINSIGYITFTNINNVDAYIRFVKDVPISSLRPLDVSKGGTGSTYLNPYTILRGNGFNPIIGTNDLIYRDSSLIVGNNSSIVITNSSSTTNLTTGSTFVAYGGVSINKELFIGKQLVVKDVDITPNKEDISAERIFNAENNVLLPDDITGFNFSDTITKSFSAMTCVNIITTSDEFDALYEIKGLRKRNGWIIDYKYIGDDIGINFYIKNNGQIQYTSLNNSNWLSSTIKFRALTTTL